MNKKTRTNFPLFFGICTNVYENNSPIYREQKKYTFRFNVDQRKKRRNCATANNEREKNPPSHVTDTSKWKANKNTTLHGYIFHNMYIQRGARVVKMHTQVLLASLKSNSKHFTKVCTHRHRDTQRGYFVCRSSRIHRILCCIIHFPPDTLLSLLFIRSHTLVVSHPVALTLTLWHLLSHFIHAFCPLSFHYFLCCRATSHCACDCTYHFLCVFVYVCTNACVREHTHTHRGSKGRVSVCVCLFALISTIQILFGLTNSKIFLLR